MDTTASARPAAAKLKAPFRMAGLILRESVKSFGFNRGLERAASLSYYGFFAMIPLMLILVVVLGSLVASSDWAMQALERAATRWSPQFSHVVLREVSTISQQRAWSVFSLLLLFWSVTPLTGAIRGAFGVIFHGQPSVSFLRAKLRDAAAVLLLLGSVLLWVTGEALPTDTVRQWLALPHLPVGALVLALRGTVALLCMGLLYVALAPVRLTFGLVTTGALLTVGLLGLIGPAFGLVLRFNPDYGYAFGSLKAIFLLFLWVYYSFAAMLFATEVMANIRRRDALVLKGLFLHPNKRQHSALVSRFTRGLNPGEVVFPEGDRGREMFYVLDGTVQLTRGGQVLREMQPGEYFGEMAMLIETPRTAAAVAGPAGATLASVSEANFETVLRENPGIVQAILREMAARLKATNDRLESLQASHHGPTP
jgi:membrane protein